MEGEPAVVLAGLEAQAERLGPPLTANAPAFESWLERARRWAEAAGRHPPLATERVERLLAVARESRKKTIDDAWQLWQEAHTAIADRARSPAYAGLELAPQEGLIPLGPDPDTGLWELGHLASGRIPLRDASGRLQTDAGTGIVFVLVPAAAGRLPFLLAKRPLTRAQWSRLAGGPPVDDGAPATDVAWAEALAVLRRHGMKLPELDEQRQAIAAAGRALQDLETGLELRPAMALRGAKG
jgi:hypothetical protein